MLKNFVSSFVDEIAKNYDIPEKPTASGGPDFGWQVFYCIYKNLDVSRH